MKYRFLLSILFFPLVAFGQGKEIYMECPSIYFGDYQPKEPKSLNDLPDSIRVKLEAHLVKRLGREFYSKLRLAGGQLVDLKQLYAVDKNAKNYQWIPYSYYLCFSFQDRAKGIERYIAQIVLDKRGKVMEEIELPDIGKYPQKANILSLQEAKAIAVSNKCYDSNTRISMFYSKEKGVIVWHFEKDILENYTWGFEKRPPMEVLEIDAHSSAVISKFRDNGMNSFQLSN